MRIKSLSSILLLWLMALCLSSYAQQKNDTTYTFRFVPQKDMFYVPWNGNGAELTRLLECVENNKAEIISGRLPVYVDGYCNSATTTAARLALAKKRSNRVKSELITRKGLLENNFVTRNHASEGNFVTVRIIKAKNNSAVTENAQNQENVESPQSDHKESKNSNHETELVTPSVNQDISQMPGRCSGQCKPSENTTFALRANLLRWATLTPDVGVEWSVGKHLSLLANATWTSWKWDGKNRRYALWEVSPEIRCYIGNKNRGYVGAMYHVGEFNYKLGAIGKQGNLMGGGLTGGYTIRLHRNLALDISVGAGCTHANYDKYRVVNGVRVKQGHEKRNYWGVNHLGVSLVWNIF